MPPPMLIVYMLLIAVVFSGVAQGKAWRVEKDGSGDFVAIQPALNAASPGDTVLIGPGRYTETELVTTADWAEEVYASVWTDSISIIGSGAGVTIIGPEYGSKQFAPRPKGIYGASDADSGTIEQLSIENVRDGIYWIRGVRVAACEIVGGVDGINLFTSGIVTIDNVEFNNIENHGIFAWGKDTLHLDNCQFISIEGGVSVIGVSEVIINSCSFSDHVVGVQYDTSIGIISDCVFSNIENCCFVSLTSFTEMSDSQLCASGLPISIGLFSHFVGSGNVVEG